MNKSAEKVDKTTTQVGKSAEKVDKTTKQRKPDTRSSYEYNDKYVKRAYYLFDMMVNLIENYNEPEELAAMNRNKRGRPFVCTPRLIAIVSRVRDVLQLPYRSGEGMCEAISLKIFRRIQL